MKHQDHPLEYPPRLHLESVTSTSGYAFEAFGNGIQAPFWITAGEQTKGRGRLGRAWVSPPGNLYASFLSDAFSHDAPLHHLPLVAAVALHDALCTFVPAPEAASLRLKWPNDVLWQRRKLAGILGETMNMKARLVVVIGFGVNCAAPPALAGRHTASLAEITPTPEKATAEAVFAALAPALEKRLQQWDSGAGFPALRRDWLARASGVGEDVQVHRGGAHPLLCGRFEDLDNQGRLCLRDAKGALYALNAGDVSLSGNEKGQ